MEKKCGRCHCCKIAPQPQPNAVADAEGQIIRGFMRRQEILHQVQEKKIKALEERICALERKVKEPRAKKPRRSVDAIENNRRKKPKPDPNEENVVLTLRDLLQKPDQDYDPPADVLTLRQVLDPETIE